MICDNHLNIIRLTDLCLFSENKHSYQAMEMYCCHARKINKKKKAEVDCDVDYSNSFSIYHGVMKQSAAGMEKNTYCIMPSI